MIQEEKGKREKEKGKRKRKRREQWEKTIPDIYFYIIILFISRGEIERMVLATIRIARRWYREKAFYSFRRR